MVMNFAGERVRFEVVFLDEDESEYDPDSQELKFYDPTGELIETKDEDDCTNTSTGNWYIDWDIPSTATAGRWVLEWWASIAVPESDFMDPYAFIVRERSWPSVVEVRIYLAGMEDDRVSDVAIEQQVLASTIEVDQEKSSSASELLIAGAYLAVSGYQTYLAYATEFERTMGMVPGPILNHLGLLKAKADQFMGYVKRGVGQIAIGPVKSYTPTVVPETYEKDAQGVKA